MQVPNGDGLLLFTCIHKNGNFVSSFLSQDICRPCWEVDPRNTLEPVDQDVPLCWTEPPRSLIMYPRDDDPECIYVVDSHKHIREISLNWLSDITSKQQENVCRPLNTFLNRLQHQHHNRYATHPYVTYPHRHVLLSCGVDMSVRCCNTATPC